MFKLNSNYFSLDDKEKFFALSMQGVKTVKNNKGISYFNIPAAFDIETSSFYENGEKRAIPYIWQFGLNGNVIIGRSFEDLQFFICWLSKKLRLAQKLRLIVYVHNLSYEFQFIRKWFTWYLDEFLADKERQPLKAVCNYFVEFRCSYRLSGYSLGNVSKNLLKYKVPKLDTLDYEKIRHEKTELTPAEMSYCINDVLVVMAYIQEEIEREGRIDLLPLTNTGRVRKYVKRACLGKGKSEGLKHKKFRDLIKDLTLTPEIYFMLKRAFQGGFVHANSYYVNREIENVSSYDFTSSYPYVMLSEKFPMSKGFDVTSQVSDMQHLNYYLNRFCCLIDIKFINLTPKIMQDNFISVSKCLELKNHVENNGRVVYADELRIVITELDFYIINQAYKFNLADIRIYKMIVFKKDYLPIDFVRAIIKLYGDKTKLKGVEGEDSNYLLSKGMLNSCYGMCVTDIVRNEYTYDNDFHTWNKDFANAEKTISEYNNENGRFLYYAWGVWVTAHARINLFRAIEKLGNDYIYADTDSVKFINLDRNKHIFDEYNKQVEFKLKQVANDRNLDYDLFKPKTIKGVEKLIGVFDFEGTYLKFKTLGAKRYMCYDGKKLSITVAGLSKNASNYLLEKYGVEGAFKHFNFEMKIPAEYSGRTTHTYLDSNYSGIVFDYKGIPCEYNSRSAIHLEKTTFEISLSEQYENFLNMIEGLTKIED